MDFRLSEADETFRQGVRDFLAKELPSDWEGGADEEGTSEEQYQFGRAFRKKLAGRGWVAMAWPKEYGGLGATHFQQLIYNEEMTYARAPGGFSMGVAWVGPAIMLYGSDEQKQKYLPRIVGDDDQWCTLYSEPGAGSDLASLQTRAVRDGDDFVVNGQKIWTSSAHRADHGWLAARTDPEAPKHKGISTFVVNMKAPGVSIQPLVNMAGNHNFNQVFFDNVRIPKEDLVGEVNRGWYHVAVALDFERSSIGASAGSRRVMLDVLDFARENPELLIRNPAARYTLAELGIEADVGRLLSYRVASMQMSGKIPNYEASVAKLYGSELTQRIARGGMQMLGTYGLLWPGSKHAKLAGKLNHLYVDSTARTVGGGTSEINRSVVATRGLGLPKG